MNADGKNRALGSIMAVGEAAHRDFAELRSALARVDAPIVASVADAERRVKTGSEPLLFLILQPWPEAIPLAAVERLRQAAPLASFWIVLGNWCEGLARSRDYFPGVERVYWHESGPRLVAYGESLRGGIIPFLPPTANDEDRLLSAPRRAWQSGSDRSPLVVVARQERQRSALAAALAEHGCDTVALPWRPGQKGLGATVTDARSVVWYATAQALGDRALWSRVSADAGGAPVVALVDFPRPEDLLQAERSGVAAVLSKPFLIGDLLRRIDECAAARAASFRGRDEVNQRPARRSKHG